MNKEKIIKVLDKCLYQNVGIDINKIHIIFDEYDISDNKFLYLYNKNNYVGFIIIEDINTIE